MNNVLVLDSELRPLMPCHPARARQMLRDGKAAIYRRFPFVIVLKERDEGDVQPTELKIDPGAKVTGIAIVAEFKRRGRVVVWTCEVVHRGDAVRNGLKDRAMFRRGRRGRKTRYRKARFLNRRRAEGWLPPSIQSRVDNVVSWATRLQRFLPLFSLTMERVKFDPQALASPGIQGVEYQQGTLLGYTIREFLLERCGHRCDYCGRKDRPLQVEHIVARSQGGSDRPGNLTMACDQCNQAKGNKSVAKYLAKKPDALNRIRSRTTPSLKDAAAVNAARFALGEALSTLGLPVAFAAGAETAFNRISQNYPKAHVVDAACAGPTGRHVHIPRSIRPLRAEATGRGHRRVFGNDGAGFPQGTPRKAKRSAGFSTGDLVEALSPRTVPAGSRRRVSKYAGRHVGRLSAVRASGVFAVRAPWKNKPKDMDFRADQYRLLQRADGYAYSLGDNPFAHADGA
jgi:5-methylcytosine-specific restriction endonuclease McrA